MPESRSDALARAAARWDDGSFLERLRRMVAIPTESQEPSRHPDLGRYLTELIEPIFRAMRYEVRCFDNPDPRGGPFLVAERIESSDKPTVLVYGHGDVVRGLADLWRDGLEPWTLTVDGDRIYGRGTVDNKGQHLIAMMALEEVAEARGGTLGFNVKFIVETGEEIGSPGLAEFLEQQKALLAADVFIGLDGPRQTLTRPEMKLGSRGAIAFDLVAKLREGQHHSGHWGGVLSDAGFVLSHAMAAIISRKGKILVPGWTPQAIPNSVRAACGDIEFEAVPGLPEVDESWGEPGLTKAEKSFAWTSVIVLASKTGTPEGPVNAVPGTSRARLQIRHTVDVAVDTFLPNLRKHLDAQGFADVEIVPVGEALFAASRTDPDHPWVQFVGRSMTETTGRSPNVIPNSSGSNPSQLFVDALGVPTIWIPNSYSGCSQHGPNEHGLAPLFREGLQIMAGIFWDIGDGKAP